MQEKPSKKRRIILVVVLLLAIVALILLARACPIPVPATPPAPTEPKVEIQKKEGAPPMDVGKAPLDIAKPDFGLPHP